MRGEKREAVRMVMKIDVEEKRSREKDGWKQSKTIRGPLVRLCRAPVRITATSESVLEIVVRKLRRTANNFNEVVVKYVQTTRTKIIIVK